MSICAGSKLKRRWVLHKDRRSRRSLATPRLGTGRGSGSTNEAAETIHLHLRTNNGADALPCRLLHFDPLCHPSFGSFPGKNDRTYQRGYPSSDKNRSIDMRTAQGSSQVFCEHMVWWRQRLTSLEKGDARFLML